MTYKENDIVGVILDEGCPQVVLKIVEVHDGHYTTLETTPQGDINGELYDDDTNHYLISRTS